MSNIATIVVIIALFAVALFVMTDNGGSPFLGGEGPIATGPGSSQEIRNPQPVDDGSNKGGISDIIWGGPSIHPSPPSAPPSIGGPTYSKQIQQTKPGYSQYEGVIKIASVIRGGASPQSEYFVLRNGGYIFSSGQTINITGWTLGTVKNVKATIPQAYEIPFITADLKDVVLPPGGEIIVSIGSSDIGINFRENGCSGYFNQYYKLTPYIQGGCMDTRYSSEVRTKFLDAGMNGTCIDFVSSLPSCQVPTLTFENSAMIGNNCIEYISKNISYNGCVKNYRDQKNFLRNSWRVFLNLPSTIFDPKHDRITLRDTNGLIVDVFEY